VELGIGLALDGVQRVADGHADDEARIQRGGPKWRAFSGRNESNHANSQAHDRSRCSEMKEKHGGGGSAEAPQRPMGT
jgi:hypothetical protein